MKKIFLPKHSLSLLLAVFTLIACTPIPGSGFEIHERTIFYVATTGNDSNLCTEPSAPCLTINGAISKANDDDQINVAAGTYNEVPLPRTGTDSNVLKIDFSVWIRGEGPGETIIDAGGANGGVYIHGDAVATLEGFTIQNANGVAPGHCIDIRDEAVVAITNVEVTRCYPGGISHASDGLVTLTNVSISQGIAGSTTEGYGISNSGRMVIELGSIGGNGSFGVISSGDLTIAGTLVENNNFDGVLVIGGEARLEGVAVTNNGLDLGFRTGVAIRNGAVVTISGSTVSANYPHGVWLQGAAAELTMENTTVSNHALTGVILDLGLANLTNVTISGNGVDAGGASALYGGLINEGIVVIRNSHITGNLNGGVFNEETGDMTIVETTLDENQGALPAIVNLGIARIENSLIANNTLESISVTPAAIDNRGAMTIINTTVSGNSHAGIAGVGGDLAMSYVTIAENEGNGIYFLTASVNQFANLLIVKNGGQDCGFPTATGSVLPTITNTGVNIDTDRTCRFAETYSDAAILLDVLADNGGRTFTHALLPGSPALDAATGACPSGDQRVAVRPFGPACDVGAFEAGGVTLSLESTPPPTPSEISAVIIEDARCRTGPGLVYPDFDFFEPGQTTIVKGRSADSNWYYVEAISFTGDCWIGKAVLQFDVAAEVLLALPIINPPPTPTPTLDPDESYDVTETPEPTVCPTLVNKPGSCK